MSKNSRTAYTLAYYMLLLLNILHMLSVCLCQYAQGDKEHVVFVSKYYYCTTTHCCGHFRALPHGPAEGGGVGTDRTGEALNYAQVLGHSHV